MRARTRKYRLGGHVLTEVTRSEQETFRLARRLARNFRGQEVVLLVGALGAGKTVFAKGIASGLGLKNHDQVCSPSFTLLNIYQGKFPIFHFDLYRLDREQDILDLGWEDYLERGVVIVEWGEKVPFELTAIRVLITRGREDERRIRIELPFSLSRRRPQPRKKSDARPQLNGATQRHNR